MKNVFIAVRRMVNPARTRPMTKVSPSNNLKEQVATELQLEAIVDKYKHRLLNANQLSDNIVDLILDTILASEEMQNDEVKQIDDTSTQDDYYDNNLVPNIRNEFKADLRAMLEGLKS